MKFRMILQIFLLAGLTVFLCGASMAAEAESGAKSEGKYTFSSDWFSPNIPNWTRVLAGMKGKPGLNYLEVGVWEGRSFVWMLDNILTHPSSKATAIDIFDKDVEKRFLDNVRRGGHASKVKLIKGYSQLKLRELPLSSFDLIYVDGDHRGKGVITDAVLAWGLLKDGGIMIFDDYQLGYSLPLEQRPEFALDVFLTLFPDEYQVVLKDYQLMVRKAPSPCNEAMGSAKIVEIPVACSRLGQYVYYWKPQKLFEVSTNREVPLSGREISIVENALTGMKMGFNVNVESQDTGAYKELLTRLGIPENEINVLPKVK
jgi:predicted O-methyltransferase YrrM